MGWLAQKNTAHAAETATSPVVEYAVMLVGATIAEIDRADTKAALLLAGSGVLLGAGTSVLVASD
jgi:hypothetical protein